MCLTLDGKIWDKSTFKANRGRLLNERITRIFFGRVLGLAEWQELVSDDHFSVDGTFIKAWASMKSFQAKDKSGKPPEDGGRNPAVDFKGERRSNDKHKSTTDPECRIYRESHGEKSAHCYMGHGLMENRTGLMVDTETMIAPGTAEREAAKLMAKRSILKEGATFGADKGYDVAEFVFVLCGMKVTPHVAQKVEGSAIDARKPRHPGYRKSLKIRKRIEEVFGWAKTVGGLRKTKYRGLQRVKAQATFTFAAYNLVRMGSIIGWHYSTA